MADLEERSYSGRVLPNKVALAKFQLFYKYFTHRNHRKLLTRLNSPKNSLHPVYKRRSGIRVLKGKVQTGIQVAKK